MRGLTQVPTGALWLLQGGLPTSQMVQADPGGHVERERRAHSHEILGRQNPHNLTVEQGEMRVLAGSSTEFPGPSAGRTFGALLSAGLHGPKARCGSSILTLEPSRAQDQELKEEGLARCCLSPDISLLEPLFSHL